MGCVSYNYGDTPDPTYTEVGITSISPNDSIWIIDKKKNRSKNRYERKLYKRNAKNLTTLKDIQKDQNEITAIEKKIENSTKKLESIKLPKKEEE